MTGALRALVLASLALAMFYYPQEVIVSATKGITLWWRFVLPALLPFFIISELLMGQGFVHFLGVLLEPLMRPLFRLPGKASFVLAMAHTSGLPIGAVLTTRLRTEKELSREEGERLLAFTSNPSPGYMFGAVATGMLGRPSLGIILASSVYLSNLLVGLLFRFYRVKPDSRVAPARPSLKRAWLEMQKAQKEDGRPLGQIIGDAISQSVMTILMVGGFITFFAVVIHMLQIWKITFIMANVLKPILGGFISFAGIEALIEGLFETTIGAQDSILAFSDIRGQIGVLTFMMGWGGLSVFAQVASFTSKTDLRFSAFVIGRTLHAFFALAISQILLVFTNIPVATETPVFLTGSQYWWSTWQLSSQVFLYSLLALATLSILIRFGQRLSRLLNL